MHTSRNTGADHVLGVLIVEDERIVAMDLQQTLVRMGYDAFAIASSADEAMRQATARRPDVVLMDIRIKGARDGIETATLLRERFGVPVVYLSAHADDATIERAKHTEPYGYLLKPVRSAELRSVLEVSFYKYKMERELRERERWFSTTLRSIADAVVAVDTCGRVTFMNAAAEELTGTSIADARDQPARDVICLPDEAQDSPLDEVLARRSALTLEEASLLSHDGGRHVISDSAAPVLDGDELLGAVMVFKDITRQKLLQRQLEAADRLASLGTMAAGIAHEVNNPLSALFLNATFVHDETARLLNEVRGNEDFCRADAIASLEAALDVHTEILATARRIARIAADLTTFSHPLERESELGDVGAAVAWAVRTTTPQLRNRARVVMELDPTPNVALDETRLGQVFLNLLLNAAHAIPLGDPEHQEVRLSARLTTPKVVTVEVSDSGCGMSDEVMSRVFEPFFTTKPTGEGTGLGLSVSYGIVKAAGGDLRVTSGLGQGTLFTVELPVAGWVSGLTSREPHDGKPISDDES